ncbi:hypothetical protein Tco_1133795 [Tanacetum coccineum]
MVSWEMAKSYDVDDGVIQVVDVVSHEMVLGRGYGVVLRWFRVVGMVSHEMVLGRGSWVWCGLEMVSGRGPRDGFRSWALRGHGMVWVMGMVGLWEDHRYSKVLEGMSVYDFLCMPSLDKGTIREEPHGLDTSILGRVADHTTSPAPAGTAIPRATPEEIVVTRPHRKVDTKADNTAKQKASTGPEISTNATKKTKSSKKGYGAGSSGQAAGDGVEQANGGTLDDGDQRDDTEFAMEDIESLDDVNQGEHINVIPLRTFDSSIGLDVTYPPILLPDKEVEPRVELSRGVRRTTRASSHASCGISEDASHRAQEDAIDVQPQDAEDDGNGSDGLTASPILMTKVPTVTLLLIPETIRKKLMEAERDAIAVEKSNVEEELVKTKSQLELRERQAEQTYSSVASFFYVGVECGLRMDRIDEEFKELSQRVDDIARLEPDKVVPSRNTSAATTSLRANTQGRHSTSSSETFGHTSTPEHLKKKKSVETGAPSAV